MIKGVEIVQLSATSCKKIVLASPHEVDVLGKELVNTKTYQPPLLMLIEQSTPRVYLLTDTLFSTKKWKKKPLVQWVTLLTSEYNSPLTKDKITGWLNALPQKYSRVLSNHFNHNISPFLEEEILSTEIKDLVTQLFLIKIILASRQMYNTTTLITREEHILPLRDILVALKNSSATYNHEPHYIRNFTQHSSARCNVM